MLRITTKKWDQYLPELMFAINSAVQETIGMSPAELHLGRKLQGPMDKILHGQNLSPDAPSYDTVEHLSQLQSRAKECCRKSQVRQLRSYNKKRRESSFKEKDRVWVRNFPQSSALHHFSAKLAPKWNGGGHWGRCPHCPRVQFKILFSHCRRNRHPRKTETP